MIEHVFYLVALAGFWWWGYSAGVYNTKAKLAETHAITPESELKRLRDLSDRIHGQGGGK